MYIKKLMHHRFKIELESGRGLRSILVSIELNFKETLETIGMKDKMFNERESGKN